MTEAAKPPPPTGAEGSVPSVARRLALYQRAGGVVTPLITALLAFIMGGIVVAVTGHNPLTTYRDIFRGTGFEWLIPGFGDRATLATNLQQTLIITTTLTLTGLAVAFAFRCGMFNIGGQGQFFAGQYVAVIVGSSWAGLAGPAHIFIAIVLAALAGAAWAGIAGFLKATVGAHEVISTIMLNWIALWVGQWMFGLGGPLHSSQLADASNPVSSPVVDKVKLPVFWGDPLLQGLHIGFFIAIGALVVYWLTLNRTTLGYEVRAVGFNPEAARYGGISVRRNYIMAMAISGTFAGLAGAIDILGWQFQLATATILTSDVGFIGIAVALLGRNTAVGTFIGAVVFGALYTGTSTRNLTSGFDPRLAGNLAKIIQGLVVLFIGADLLVLYVWQARKKLRLKLKRAEKAST
jgi:general nucleoside transport system permease protein